MKKFISLVAAVSVAASTFGMLVSAAPLYSYHNGNTNSKWDGTNGAYGVPAEDIVHVPLDIRSQWTNGGQLVDHPTESAAMKPLVADRYEKAITFRSGATLNMTNVAKQWNAYLDTAVANTEMGGARDFAIENTVLTGEYVVTITTEGTGASSNDTLQGIENLKLANAQIVNGEIDGLVWNAFKVNGELFNVTDFFEYVPDTDGSPNPVYTESDGVRTFTVKMRIKDDIDKVKFDRYLTVAKDGSSDYFFSLSIDDNIIRDVNAGKLTAKTYKISGEFEGNVNLEFAPYGTALLDADVYFGSYDSANDEETPLESVTDDEYIRLQYVSGGGGAPRPTVTPGGSSPTESPSPTPVASPQTGGTDKGAKLNYDDHYAYIIGYPVKEGQSEDMREVRPQNNITRAEVATIFFRMLTDESRAKFWTQDNVFSDVDITDWFNNAISTAANASIVEGYDDGTFNPNAAITRAEFATIASRFSSVTYSGSNKFNDISGHWAAQAINDAAETGWITGYEDGSFKPNNKISRAEAMTIINRMLYRLVEKEGLKTDIMVEWIDNKPDAWYYAAVQEATNSHYYERVALGYYETWTEYREPRDWEALEKEYSKVTDAGSEESVFDTSGMDTNVE